MLATRIPVGIYLYIAADQSEIFHLSDFLIMVVLSLVKPCIDGIGEGGFPCGSVEVFTVTGVRIVLQFADLRKVIGPSLSAGGKVTRPYQ